MTLDRDESSIRISHSSPHPLPDSVDFYSDGKLFGIEFCDRHSSSFAEHDRNKITITVVVAAPRSSRTHFVSQTMARSPPDRVAEFHGKSQDIAFLF